MQWHPDAKIGPTSDINEADKQHAAKQGQTCPKCGSEAISGEEIMIDTGHAVQEMGCGDCDATWTDVYALIGFAGLREGESENEEDEEEESESDAS